MGEKMNIVEAVNAAIYDEMENDEDVVAYGEDVGEDGGVFRATKGLQEEFGEDRCFSSPLAESGIVGTGIGMSLYGFRPVVEMQFSGFSYLAVHQIKEHSARMRMRSRNGFEVPMTIRAPYGGGINALEHHQESPEAYFAHAEGLHVVIPSNPQDTYSLLRKSIQMDDPVVFLEPKKIYRAFSEEVDREKEVDLEDAKVVREGEDVTPCCPSLGPLLNYWVRAIDTDRHKSKRSSQFSPPRESLTTPTERGKKKERENSTTHLYRAGFSRQMRYSSGYCAAASSFLIPSRKCR